MNPLFIISLDALGYSDEDVYKNLPFFKKCINQGTWIRRFKSIYPTLTYPIHSTVVSGRYPTSHGIDNNLKLEPEKQKMDWYWDEVELKGDSIFRAAKRKNLKVAAFRWPATGFGDISFNLPEAWSFDGEYLKDHLMRKGSSDFILELEEKFGEFTAESTQDEKDEYISKAAAYTFEKYQPDITFMHLVDVDHIKHRYGAKHFGINRGIERLDKRLDELFENISKIRPLDEINIMFMSDHSQIDTSVGIRLNKMLEEMNLLIPNPDGTTNDYEAYFLTCGGSAALYLKNPADKELIEKIENRILELEIEGIDRIFSEQEIKNMGASSRAVLWVEAKEGFAFEATAIGEIISEENVVNVAGNHGFLPEKEGNLAMGIFVGPAFHKGKIIEMEELIRFAPTVDKILNLGIEDMVEREIEEALV